MDELVHYGADENLAGGQLAEGGGGNPFQGAGRGGQLQQAGQGVVVGAGQVGYIMLVDLGAFGFVGSDVGRAAGEAAGGEFQDADEVVDQAVDIPFGAGGRVVKLGLADAGEHGFGAGGGLRQQGYGAGLGCGVGHWMRVSAGDGWGVPAGCGYTIGRSGA